jgi:hypothetical protein
VTDKPKIGNEKSGFKPDPSLLQGAKFHDNITQVYIRTTEDKLRNHLRDFKDGQSIITKWSIPLGLVISLGATLLTTTFTDKFDRPASFWEALFTFAFMASAFWLVVSIIKSVCCSSKASIEHLIKKIKNEE